MEYKSFIDFIHDILGHGAGFFVGWTYWFCWVVIGMADIIAITGYFQFWFPAIPLWLPGLLCILIMTALNMLTVKLFGELEFWFALIKIVAIAALVLIGGYLVLTGFINPTSGEAASLSHLWARQGGIFPHGISGFFAAFQIAFFAFLGIELVGTAAAETKDPYTTLPRAINSIPIRIIIFYVLSLTVIMAVTPWDMVNPKVSPFVNMFTLIGIPIAASLINFVVLTSALSSANGGMFSTGRMLYGLAQNNAAPKIFGQLNINGVPSPALVFSCSFLFLSIILTYLEGDVMNVFTVVTTVASIGFIFVWSMILLAYIKYRKTRPELHEQSTYKMPGGSVMAWICLLFLVSSLYLFSHDEETLNGILFSPIWFITLGVIYLVKFRKET